MLLLCFGFFFYGAQSGVILATYDAAVLVVSAPVGYFGASAHQPFWLGIGFVVISVGFFLFSLPHFLAGTYDPEGGIVGTPLCNPANPEKYVFAAPWPTSASSIPHRTVDPR